jgi:hypothetical protein
MANISGWWTLEIEDGCIPDDFDLEHIAEQIRQVNIFWRKQNDY